MTTEQTACILCSRNCGLRVEIEGEARITSVRGDPAHPVSKGYVCRVGALRCPSIPKDERGCRGLPPSVLTPPSVHPPSVRAEVSKPSPSVRPEVSKGLHSPVNVPATDCESPMPSAGCLSNLPQSKPLSSPGTTLSPEAQIPALRPATRTPPATPDSPACALRCDRSRHPHAGACAPPCHRYAHSSTSHRHSAANRYEKPRAIRPGPAEP